MMPASAPQSNRKVIACFGGDIATWRLRGDGGENQHYAITEKMISQRSGAHFSIGDIPP
jgi:hypothetical protein